MLRLALLCLVLALVAGLFEFNLVAGMSLEAAKLLFGVFIILAVIFFLVSIIRGDGPAPPV
jgi:uncharacterized membrane protein YtjA (UPF0391 family)